MFTHANPRASGSVATSGAGRRTDTARRASGDATASSLIGWKLFPYVYGRITSLVKQNTPSGAVRAAYSVFSPKSDWDTARETVGPDSHRDPQAWFSRTGTLRAQTAEPWCSRTGTFQAHIPRTASYGLAPSAFDPSLEYSTENAVLFSQPPSYFSQWSPS